LPRFADSLKRRDGYISWGLGEPAVAGGEVEVGDANRVGDESGSEFASCSLHLNASTAFWFVAAAAVRCGLRTGIPSRSDLIRSDPAQDVAITHVRSI